MNRENVEVLNLLMNMFCKVLVTLVLLGCLVTAMWKLMNSPNWPVGGVVSILGFSFAQMARHFFPTNAPESAAAMASASASKELPPAA